MIKKETVLVLGAGASKVFGFPTAEELVGKINKILGDETSRLGKLYFEVADQFSPDMAKEFPKALKGADPPSVDFWLEQNPDFINVGKVAIAIAMLAYEGQSILKPRYNWYKLLSKRMRSPFELFQENKVTIVTLNYDRSLEKYLFETFRHTHLSKSAGECKDTLNQLKIIHVYGSLGRLNWQSDISLPVIEYGQGLNQKTVKSAAESIKIMPEVGLGRHSLSGIAEKAISNEFDLAQTFIWQSNAIYFLGFGYHETNMTKLGFQRLVKQPKIMGTIKGLGGQEIHDIVKHLPFVGRRMNERFFDDTVYNLLHKHVDFN